MPVILPTPKVEAGRLQVPGRSVQFKKILSQPLPYPPSPPQVLGLVKGVVAIAAHLPAVSGV